MGSSNETSAYGPVISPWRREGSNVGLTPGGSSGGSAAAVAASNAPGETGTDTGGPSSQPPALVDDGLGGLEPPARGLLRHLRDQAALRPLLALGDRRLRQLARPGRPD